MLSYEMRTLAYKTYLIGQTSKLAQPAELAVYVYGSHDRKPLDKEFWSLLGLGNAPSNAETESFARSHYAESVLSQLPEHSLRRLTEIFSHHHRNCVYTRIQENSSWKLENFPMPLVEVGYMESELKQAISRLQHQLTLLAKDSEILKHANYKDRDLESSVPYDIFLATRSKSTNPRLIDGNHRAIHKARQLLAGYIDDAALKIVVPVHHP